MGPCRYALSRGARQQAIVVAPFICRRFERFEDWRLCSMYIRTFVLNLGERTQLPTYVYKCTACAAGYELREGFSAPAQHDCPECGALSRRMPVATAVIFKGSGFYRTEGRKEDSNGSSSSDSSSESSSSDSKSEPSSSGATSDSASTGAASDGRSSEKSATDEKSATKSSDTSGSGDSSKPASTGHGHSHGPGSHTH